MAGMRVDWPCSVSTCKTDYGRGKLQTRLRQEGRLTSTKPQPSASNISNLSLTSLVVSWETDVWRFSGQSDNETWSWVPRDLDPRNNELARASSNLAMVHPISGSERINSWEPVIRWYRAGNDVRTRLVGSRYQATTTEHYNRQSVCSSGLLNA